MSIKIAVMADIHLSNVPGTAQEAALVFALKRLQSEKPDVVLFIGDLTAAGDLESAERVRAMLDESGLCFRMIPGNSDERTSDLRAAVANLLTVDAPFCQDEYAVCLLDVQEGKITPRGIDRLTSLMESIDVRRIILGCHYPISVCLENPYVNSLIKAGNISLFINGHVHYDEAQKIGQTSVYSVRGLDPDKAMGGLPAVAIFELNNQEWQTHSILFEAGGVSGWSVAERRDFCDHLGVSCMSMSLEALHSAALHGVRCVELRALNALSVPRAELLQAVRCWRDSGGTYLSIHMPDLVYDRERASITGIRVFQGAVSLALDLNVEHMLLHVPRVSVGQMQPGSEVWSDFSDTFLNLIQEPIEKGVMIGVENLHMNPGEVDDDARGFGYLPEECLAWMQHLRKTSGYDRIGIHLDIGHARNNPPFSSKLSIGQWYALVGKEIVGYHVHQVVMRDGVMKNHYPIKDVHGPLISLSSFFWSWNTGCLRHAPMFLEIRSKGLADIFDSLKCIRQYVNGV